MLEHPYPHDVDIAWGGSPEGQDEGRPVKVIRSCSQEEIRQHADALLGTVMGAVQGRNMSLFNFELIMLALLGVALPVVYWRKIRIRHL